MGTYLPHKCTSKASRKVKGQKFYILIKPKMPFVGCSCFLFFFLPLLFKHSTAVGSWMLDSESNCKKEVAFLFCALGDLLEKA